MIQQTKQRFCQIQKKKGRKCHIPKQYQTIIRNSELLPDEDDDSYSDEEQTTDNKQEKHLINIPVILPSKNLEWLNGEIMNSLPKFADFSQLNKTGIKQIKITLISEHLKSFYFSADANKGSLYIDRLFDPSNKSLTGQWGQIQKFKEVKWVRISQICKNSLFSQKLSPFDLVQGKFGNGYFIAAIAALLQKPQRIISLFLAPFREKQNYYSVKLLKRGKWRIVDIDDYIPTILGKPITSWTRSKDIWIMILQKAYAKQYSSFMRASIGHIEDAFRDLTGAPIKFFNLREKNLSKQNLWKYLLKASRKEYSMCATILNGSEQKTSFIGWACGYACTLIKAFDFSYNKTSLQIICLRNPWEPITNQHFKNTKSIELHNDLINYLRFPQNQRQGIYFLQFQQFLNEFRSLTIAQINDNASYISESYNDLTKSGVYFNVSVKQTGYYSFQVDKTPKQLLTSKKLIGYKYPLGIIRIYNMYQNNKLIHEFQDCQRLTSRKFLLGKGHYLVYVYINFDKVYDQEFQINLGIYSESICTIELAKIQDFKNVKQPIIKQKHVKAKSRSIAKSNEQNLRSSSLVKFHYVSPDIKHNQNSPQKPKQIPKTHLQIKQKIQQNNEKGPEDTRGRDLKGEEWIKMQSLIHNSQLVVEVGKIGQDLVQKQIVYLEPSPTKDKLDDLRKSKKDYIDERFPPNISSLSGQWGNLQQWKNVRWQRISKIMPQAKIFQGKITPQSIKQGFLGDCYFLAGIAALAERPDRISNLFLLHEKNEINFYSVKMLYKGKWLTIDMDDYIPYMYDLPAFSRGNQNELWVILLEKAWAKVYSSYKRIEAGFPEQTLHDLTGAPIRHIYLQKSSFDAQKQWVSLLQSSKVEHSMVASSQVGSDYLQSVSGLVDGHAYTLLNALELKFRNRIYRLLQLRNPWGKGESKGAWSDNDPIWNEIDQDTKKSIGYSKLDDGIFFLDYETFCKNFKIITIAQINDNASYVYRSVKDSSQSGCFFKVQILQKGTYSFQVDSTPQRTFQVKYNTQYRYPNISYQMGQLINPKYVKRLTSIQSNTRTSYYKNTFEKGFYICYVKIDFDSRFEKDFDVNLAIYGDCVSNIELASRNEAILFSNNQQVRWRTENKKHIQEKIEWNGLRSYRKDE